MSGEWTKGPTLARVAGVSEQRIREIARQGGRWHGAQLIFRMRPGGRGGLSGGSYDFFVPSLPADLQLAYNEARARDLGAIVLRDDDAANAMRNYKWSVIEPCVKHPKRSPARADAVREATKPFLLRPGKSTPKQESESTINRWIAAYERDKAAGLQRRPSKRRGRKQYLISRRWDRATAGRLPELKRVEIRDELVAYAKGLVARGEKGTSLAELVSRKLFELTAAAGVRVGNLRAVCRVPRTFTDPLMVYRKVHEFFRTDRKSYMDHAAPRVLRTRAGLMPMDIVVGDVHPVDVLVRREDGSVATFRAIAWLDVSTNRIWVDLVLLPKGEGVRNAHVIASFRRMVAAWGAPRALYLDGGSEYNFAPFIDDALRLIDRATGARIISEIDSAGSGSQIMRAGPYAPQSKPIEGIFGILEQNHSR